MTLQPIPKGGAAVMVSAYGASTGVYHRRRVPGRRHERGSACGLLESTYAGEVRLDWLDARKVRPCRRCYG